MLTDSRRRLSAHTAFSGTNSSTAMSGSGPSAGTGAGGPYGGKGKGKTDKGKGKADKGKGESDKGKGDSKGNEPHVCEDTEQPDREQLLEQQHQLQHMEQHQQHMKLVQQMLQQYKQLQELSTLQNARIQQLEEQVADTERQLKWILRTLDVVLPLPENIE